MHIEVIRVGEIPSKAKLDKIRSDYRRGKRIARFRLWAFIILMAVLAVVIWMIGHAEQATVTQAGDQVVNQTEQATVTQAGDQVVNQTEQATVTQAGDQVVNQAEQATMTQTGDQVVNPTAPITTTMHKTWLPIILIEEKNQ